MPTYDYVCDACDHAFEEFQSMSDKPLKKCPKCGKAKLRRLFGTGAALLFKGSGFYATDYRSDSYKAAAQKDQPGAADKSASQKDQPSAVDKSASNGTNDTGNKSASAKSGSGADSAGKKAK